MQEFIIAAVAAGAVASMPGTASAETYNRISMTQLSGLPASGGHLVRSTSNQDVVQVGGTFLYLTDCNSSGVCAELNIFRNHNDVSPTLDAINTCNNSKKIP